MTIQAIRYGWRHGRTDCNFWKALLFKISLISFFSLGQLYQHIDKTMIKYINL